MSAIRQYARALAEQFDPEKIILFGSHAYGKPHADSDVDILVVMAGRDPLQLATRIDRALEAPFPLDLHVRTPESMAWRLREGDAFLQEIVAKGKVLHEKADPGMGTEGRIRPPAGSKARARK